jgi:hypothetical protein
MRLPGRAWLEFEVTPNGDGSVIRQTAVFDPVGLAGLAYWYGVYPLHQLVFHGMLRGLARAARASGPVLSYETAARPPLPSPQRAGDSPRSSRPSR